jgi:hypothetical protein
MSSQDGEIGLQSGKNYALNLIKHLMKMGVQLRNGIETLEDRFLSN